MNMKTYEVRVQGELDDLWNTYFAPFVNVGAGGGETVFRASFRDQSEMLSSLAQFQSANVKILSVVTIQGEQK